MGEGKHLLNLRLLAIRPVQSQLLLVLLNVVVEKLVFVYFLVVCLLLLSLVTVEPLEEIHIHAPGYLDRMVFEILLDEQKLLLSRQFYLVLTHHLRIVLTILQGLYLVLVFHDFQLLFTLRVFELF